MLTNMAEVVHKSVHAASPHQLELVLQLVGRHEGQVLQRGLVEFCKVLLRLVVKAADVVHRRTDCRVDLRTSCVCAHQQSVQVTK